MDEDVQAGVADAAAATTTTTDGSAAADGQEPGTTDLIVEVNRSGDGAGEGEGAGGPPGTRAESPIQPTEGAPASSGTQVQPEDEAEVTDDPAPAASVRPAASGPALSIALKRRPPGVPPPGAAPGRADSPGPTALAPAPGPGPVITSPLGDAPTTARPAPSLLSPEDVSPALTTQELLTVSQGDHDRGAIDLFGVEPASSFDREERRSGLLTNVSVLPPVVSTAPANPSVTAAFAWEVGLGVASVLALVAHQVAPHAPWLWAGAAAASLLAMAASVPRCRIEWVVVPVTGFVVVAGLLRATPGGLLAGTAAALFAAVGLQVWPQRALFAIPALLAAGVALYGGPGTETLAADGQFGYLAMIVAGGALLLAAADPLERSPLCAALLGPGLLLLASGSAGSTRPALVAWGLAVIGVAIAAAGRPVVGTSLLVGSAAAMSASVPAVSLVGVGPAVPLALGVAAAVACGRWLGSGSDTRTLGFLIPGILSLVATLGPVAASPVWIGWGAAAVLAPRPYQPASWRQLARPGSLLLLVAAVALVSGPGRLIPGAGT